MARINIDDQFWVDLLPVAIAVGNSDEAIGQVVRFFRLAQEKHKNGRLITEDEFSRAGFSPSILGVFADRVEGGIQAVGAQKHFGWLAKRVEAGRSGGRSKTEAKLKSLKQNRSKQKQVEASSSYSPSSSYSNSPSSNLPAPISSDANKVNPVSLYCDLWKEKYGKSPDIRGKESGQIQQLVKDMGPSRTMQIMRSYFSMPDPFFIQRSYNLDTMLLNLAKIAAFEGTGKIVTRELMNQVEKKVDKLQGTKLRRSIAEIEADETNSTLLKEAT